MNKEDKMKRIFEPTKIKNLTLKNRLIRSATWEGMANSDGTVSDKLLKLYENLAIGDVGLIISSYIYVRTDGRQQLNQLGADCDDKIPSLKKLAETIHNSGGKIVGQIVHCGGQASKQGTGGVQPLAPSQLTSPGYPELPQELPTSDIPSLIESFANAALRLKKAGFDGVQLHGAHGYLLSEFLSPARNQRIDQYGGNLTNRSRLTMEVYRAIREKVGDDFPIIIKLNADDFLEDSTTTKDSIFLANLLAQEGLDCIEISGGTAGSKRLGPIRSKINSIEDEAYFLPEAKEFRKAIPNIPLMLVGGIRSYEKIESILNANTCDYFSFSRPLVCEPNLPARWQSGDLTKAKCTSCNKCFRAALSPSGIECTYDFEK